MDINKSVQNQILEYVADLSGLNPAARLSSSGGYAISVGVSKSSQCFLNHSSLCILPCIFYGKAMAQDTVMADLFSLCNTIPKMTSFLSDDTFEIVDIAVGNFPSFIGSESNGMFLWSCSLNVLYYMY